MISASNELPACTRSPTNASPPSVSIPSPGCNAPGANTGRNASGGASSKGIRSIQKSAVRVGFFLAFSNGGSTWEQFLSH